MEEIPKELIINLNQIIMKCVSVSNWTFEEKRAKRVEIADLDEKQQITVLLSCTMDGKLLPARVIYTGKTPACLPKGHYHAGWYLTYSKNHWSITNEYTMMGYPHKILIPYVNATHDSLELSKVHPAMVNFDIFKGQTTQRFVGTLEEDNILVVKISPNCTDQL